MSGIRWNNVPGNPRGIADAVASAEPLKDAWKSLTGAATDAIKSYETRKTDEHTNAYLQALEQVRNADQLQTASTQDALNKIYQQSNGLIDGAKTRGAYDKRLDTLTSFARDEEKHKTNMDIAEANIANTQATTKGIEITNDFKPETLQANIDSTKANTDRTETALKTDQLTLAAAEQKQQFDEAKREIMGQAFADKDANAQAAIGAMEFLTQHPSYANNFFTADDKGNPIINTAAVENFRKPYLNNPAALENATPEVKQLFDALGKVSVSSSDTVYYNDAIEKYAKDKGLSPGVKAQLIQEANANPEAFTLSRQSLGGDAVAEKQAQAEAEAARELRKRFSFTGGTPDYTAKELDNIRTHINDNSSKINEYDSGGTARMLTAATKLINGFQLPDGRTVYPNAEVINIALDMLDYGNFSNWMIFHSAPDKLLEDTVKTLYMQGLKPEEQEKLKADTIVEMFQKAGAKENSPPSNFGTYLY